MFRNTLRKLVKIGAAMLVGLWLGTLAVFFGIFVAGAPQRMVNTMIAGVVIGGTIGWAMTTQDESGEGRRNGRLLSDISQAGGRKSVANRERRADTNCDFALDDQNGRRTTRLMTPSRRT